MGIPRMIILIRHAQSEGNSGPCPGISREMCTQGRNIANTFKKTEKSTKQSQTTV